MFDFSSTFLLESNPQMHYLSSLGFGFSFLLAETKNLFVFDNDKCHLI